MIRSWSFSLFLCTIAFSLFSQQKSTLSGKISYLTSQNVYATFDHTSDIQIGDTLLLAKNNQACLLVSNKSSRSCVCVLINDCEVQKNDVVHFSPTKQEENQSTALTLSPHATETIPKPIESTPNDMDLLLEEPTYERDEVIRGRVSVSNYQNIASARDNRNRLMSRFWIDAQHINHSKFSFEAQVNYRQIFLPDFTPPTNFLNIYNLAIRYDAKPDLSLTFGRKINPKTASLGAIDGLQAEKYIGKSYIGLILGSRPDISTYGINPNLLEYGGYIGRESRKKGLYAQTTLGLIEQRNAGKIDRRYAYFQHSSTIARNLNLFSSLELDLYQSVNGIVSNSLRLPNLYVAGTYRFGRKASLTLSYDSRKRILYYETFQTEIERMLNDDLAREGVRARINLRPIKYLSTGISYSQRFQNDKQNKSDNLYGYITYSRLPGIGGRLSATYNVNKSNYLSSNILSIRHSRTLIPKKLDADLYYRMADYRFINSERQRIQHYYGVNLSLHLTDTWSLRLATERADFNQETNYRVYARIIRRFYRKR